ncbi:MAG: hypothetical protein ACI9JT_001533 [Polaribacter sp.]
MAAVFEINIIDSDKKKEITQGRMEKAYNENIKGLYKLLAVATLSLIAPVILAITDASNWSVFFMASIILDRNRRNLFSECF